MRWAVDDNPERVFEECFLKIEGILGYMWCAKHVKIEIIQIVLYVRGISTLICHIVLILLGKAWTAICLHSIFIASYLCVILLVQGFLYVNSLFNAYVSYGHPVRIEFTAKIANSFK